MNAFVPAEISVGASDKKVYFRGYNINFVHQSKLWDYFRVYICSKANQ